MQQRKYDVILMGATSFVGQITAWRMAEYFRAQQSALKWAWAGRSVEKLQQVMTSTQQRLGGELTVDLLQGDSMSAADMQSLAQQARVIISTVGPYDLYGEQLVKACAENGTHYCDLTGEANFIADMLGKYEADAQQNGACIVHCCGFDSVPFDINTYFLQTQAKKMFGESCTKVEGRVMKMRGTFSGGTMASLVNIVKRSAEDKVLRKKMLDPYLLASALKPHRQPYIGKVQWDALTERWMAPFVMAAINCKIVMRSVQQRPDLYPAEMTYAEGMVIGKSFRSRLAAHGVSLGLGAITLGSALSPTRWLMENYLLPKPGEGPSEDAQIKGHYRVRHYGETASGKKLVVEVQGDMDPGYGSTAKILLQAAIALAEDLPPQQRGGFYTPAALIGDSLLKRLPMHAGVNFKVV